MKEMLVPIDQAGRIVLPKDVRKELAIQPGDMLRLTLQGTLVTLALNKEKGGLQRKGKALVFMTPGNEKLSPEMVEAVVREVREERSPDGLHDPKPKA